MKYEKSKIFFLVFVFIYSGCSNISPDTKRLGETSMFGALLGGTIAVLAKVEPLSAIIVGTIIGYNEGEKINEEISEASVKLKNLDNSIITLQTNNERLERSIEEKKKNLHRLSTFIDELEANRRLNQVECKKLNDESNAAIRKINFIKSELNNVSFALINKIESIENKDYNYEESKKLAESKLLYKNIKEYIQKINQTKTKLIKIENITWKCR